MFKWELNIPEAFTIRRRFASACISLRRDKLARQVSWRGETTGRAFVPMTRAG